MARPARSFGRSANQTAGRRQGAQAGNEDNRRDQRVVALSLRQGRSPRRLGGAAAGRARPAAPISPRQGAARRTRRQAAPPEKLPGMGCLLIASPRHSAEPIDEADGGGVEDAPWNPVFSVHRRRGPSHRRSAGVNPDSGPCDHREVRGSIRGRGGGRQRPTNGDLDAMKPAQLRASTRRAVLFRRRSRASAPLAGKPGGGSRSAAAPTRSRARANRERDRNGHLQPGRQRLPAEVGDDTKTQSASARSQRGQ